MFTAQILDLKNLIIITNTGIKVATFSQIKASLIARYKEIYGSDIEIVDTNADGIFINDLALIINNILQSCQTAFANLDINTANGIYLDRLCALTNLRRKQATHSTAGLTIKNLDTENSVEIENGLKFVDKAGLTWTYNDLSFIIPASSDENNLEMADIMVECDEFGPISAPPGWIFTSIETLPIEVVQSVKAQIGENEESDQDFRARQAASNGNQGITVLDGLINDLLSLNGIKDAYIFNNNSENTIVNACSDNTDVLAHSIYIILKGIFNDELRQKICNIIFEDLTPGINSTECDENVIAGNAGQGTYQQGISAGAISFNTNVYWKEATGIHPTITINIQTLPNYTLAELDEVEKDLITYLNSLPIMTDLTEGNILAEAVYADPQFKGKSTYQVNSVSITGAVNGKFTNTGSFYEYTSMNRPSGTGSIQLVLS